MLNLYPCGDEEPASKDVLTTVTTIDFDGDHEHGALDLCSPFCNCHCCHVHAITSPSFYTELNKVDFSAEIFEGRQVFSQDISFRFFHPPRVIG